MGGTDSYRMGGDAKVNGLCYVGLWATNGMMLYTDDLAVVVESMWEMQEVLGSGRRHLGSMG